MKKIIYTIVIAILLLSPIVLAEDSYTAIQGEDLFNDTVKNITQGSFSLLPGDILKYIYDTLIYEIRSSKGLILSIFMTAAVSGILGTASNGKGASQAAEFVCYCIITTAVVRLICITVGYGTEVIGKMCEFVTKLAPMLSILLISSGYSASAAAFYPVFSSSVYFISLITEKCIVPLIYAGCVISILNNISSRVHLNNFSRLIKSVTQWLLTASLTIFTGINAIYGFSVPAADTVAMKTAKFAVGSMVPVVGGFVAESIDTVITGAKLMKSAVGTAGIITLAVSCAVPVIKVSAVLITLKVSAAIIEPMSEKKYADMLSEAAETLTSVFAMIIASALLFTVTIAIIIGAAK